ncbi:TPA: flagellar FlbD family protein [Enterobacter kobei]|nr:flagellar FlbD family protein [Enterobacter kobei]
MIIKLTAIMVSDKRGDLTPINDKDIYLNDVSISRFIKKDEGTLITLVDGFKTLVKEQPYEIFCTLNGIQDRSKVVC